LQNASTPLSVMRIASEIAIPQPNAGHEMDGHVRLKNGLVVEFRALAALPVT
jgi:hypothetical protein